MEPVNIIHESVTYDTTKKNARISDPIGFEPFRNDQTHNNSKNNNNNNGTIYNIIESVVSSEEGNHLSLECTKDN